MAKKSGLGKGLDALFADNSFEEQSGSSPIKLKVTEIEPNKGQPRKVFDEAALLELADSISINGVIQPLLVRPLPDGSYQLVAGERRWRAARMAGLSEVPVIIRELDDSKAMELALIENIQREDLNPIEAGEGIKNLMDSYNLTQDEAAKRIGMSRSSVANTLRLLNLPEEVKDMVQDGELSAGHARALLAFENPQLILEAANLVIKKGLSVREIERLAKKQPNGDDNVKLRYRDPYYDEVEITLTATLGQKIKVVEGKGKNLLEIEFYSKEDLTRIANILGKDD